jgi:hypothetical protein
LTPYAAQHDNRYTRRSDLEMCGHPRLQECFDHLTARPLQVLDDPMTAIALTAPGVPRVPTQRPPQAVPRKRS